MTHVYSMTGFGSARIDSTLCQLSLQLKSVNSRFLDLSFKMPEELAGFEGFIREQIAQRIKRGKIECKISWQTSLIEKNEVQINVDALQQTIALQNLIMQHAPLAQPLNVAQLMQIPSILPSASGSSAIFASVTLSEIERLVDHALTSFLTSRTTEGAHLVETLYTRLNAMAHIVAQLQSQLPELLAHQEAKLTERLFKAVDQNKVEVTISREELIERIKQEASLTAIRVDVAEELDRLNAHINNTRQIIQQGDSNGIGKRLDFLMQEFNREANTLGSKSASLLQTQASMNLKIIIEQMREQVQNLE